MAIFNFAALSIDPTLNDSTTSEEKSARRHTVVGISFPVWLYRYKNRKKIDRRKKGAAMRWFWSQERVSEKSSSVLLRLWIYIFENIILNEIDKIENRFTFEILRKAQCFRHFTDFPALCAFPAILQFKISHKCIEIRSLFISFNILFDVSLSTWNWNCWFNFGNFYFHIELF